MQLYKVNVVLWNNVFSVRHRWYHIIHSSAMALTESSLQLHKSNCVSQTIKCFKISSTGREQHHGWSGDAF